MTVCQLVIRAASCITEDTAVLAVACSSSRADGETDETRETAKGLSEDGVSGNTTAPKLDGAEEFKTSSIVDPVPPCGIETVLPLAASLAE
jgi:hypothetical protein